MNIPFSRSPMVLPFHSWYDMQGAAHMMMTTDSTINFLVDSLLSQGCEVPEKFIKKILWQISRSYSEVSEVRKRCDD